MHMHAHMQSTHAHKLAFTLTLICTDAHVWGGQVERTEVLLAKWPGPMI